ncbi:sensor histidine kinase [Hymenobacter psychrophilus]|uniref:sensor histidine kinase n=1 Tax=Hymenobacter psychrophilus TaxID=651662 RepID=UPI001C31AE07|nr:histidine kinase [Hymenobacter psychrophilus]
MFATLYAGAIAYSVQEVQPGAFPDYLRRTLLYDYTLKALWTVPVWWLLFRTPLDAAGWARKLSAHLLLAPLWVAAWFSSYYGLLQLLGATGMRGPGRVWDVYIPLLFYGVQFGLFHTVRFTQQLRQQHRLAEQLRFRAHQSKLAALKAQINPHFLFNTLNTLSASVPPEQEPTRALIAQLAHTFRFALEATRHELLPLREEIQFLEAYLALEQARFGSRLRVDLLIEPELLSWLVPPMLLQPLVENAVKHGISPCIAGGAVRVRLYAAGARCLGAEVTDTGVGWPQGQPPDLATSPGLGLGNTHARLLALGSAGLELLPHAPTGACVRFSFSTDISPSSCSASAL